MKVSVKKFGQPDETRPFAGKGRAEILKFSEGTVGLGIFEPGWRWSTHVKPLAQTESCESTHAGYVLDGRMRIQMDDGESFEVGPGDVTMIPPGHDAWVVGEKTCVMLDFSGMESYALPQERREAAAEERPGAS